MIFVEATWQAARQGAIDGVLGTLFIGGYLIFVRDGVLRQRFRNWSFVSSLLVNAGAMLLLFLITRGIGQVITDGDPRVFLLSFTDYHLVQAIPFFAVVVLAIEFVIRMNRIIGSNIVRYYVTGAYHRPVEEERIFLLIDLGGSTGLAERLGNRRYHEFVRAFVDDLSEPVLETRGYVWQYAGDEVVITWHGKAVSKPQPACAASFWCAMQSSCGLASTARSSERYPRFGAACTGEPSSAERSGISSRRSSSRVTYSTRLHDSKTTPAARSSPWWFPTPCST